MDPTFGSQFDGGAYFAACDSRPYFIIVDRAPPAILHALATRAGGELIPPAAEAFMRRTPDD